MRLTRGAIFVLLLSCGLNCARSGGGLPTVEMKIGRRNFTLEVAATPEAQETGLMHRDAMDRDHGMIFVFPAERELDFWMKNTRIPLDILFLDRRGRIVSIHHMLPYDLTPVPSDFPAQYAVEINAGAASAAEVAPGDRLSIPASARAK